MDSMLVIEILENRSTMTIYEYSFIKQIHQLMEYHDFLTSDAIEQVVV